MSRIAHRPDIRLAHLLGTIDETLRFICFVLTSDYLAATHEAPDPKVEGLLMNLQDPSTQSVLELVKRLVHIPTPRAPYVPEFRAALRGPLADDLESLIADSSAVRIERNTLTSEDCDAWNRTLGPRVDQLLAGFQFMDQLLLVRCEHVGAHTTPPPGLYQDDDAGTWHLQGWRGVGNARPMLVRAARDAFPPERTVLLMRPERPDALRLDPFLVPGGDGRLLSLMGAPDMVEIIYGHYPSGQQVIWDVPLGRVLAERGMRKGRIPLSLSEDSAMRLRNHVTVPTSELPGYVEAIQTTIDEQGEHFRAVDQKSGAIHSVVRMHPHRIRDEAHLQELILNAEQLRRIQHPNLATPDTIRFDAKRETLVTGTLHPPYGRLIDQMPPGTPLPVQWSIAVAEALLTAVEALSEHNVHLLSLPAWAVSLGAQSTDQTDVGSRVHVVPLLAGTGGRLADAGRMVATLLYQMLTGNPPDELELEPHIVRGAIPLPLSQLVMEGLDGVFEDPAAMRKKLHELSVSTNAPSGTEFANRAVARAFAHLQRLRPGVLSTLEEALVAAEAESDREASRACAQRLIEAHWDPGERLAVLAQLLRQEDLVLVPAVLKLVEDVVHAAGDHLPTLLYVAREAGELIRSSDLVRIRRRIMEFAHDIDELSESAYELAQLCETRGELEEADQFWARLTEMAPNRLDGWLGRVRVARVLASPAERARRLEAAIDRINTGELKCELIMELARLKANQLDDIRGAICAYREVVIQAPHGIDAWLALRDLAREAYDDESLAVALTGLTACDAADQYQKKSARLEYIVRFGHLPGHQVSTQKALDALIATHPDERDVLSAHIDHLERQGAYEDAADILERWAGAEAEPWCFKLLLKRLARLSTKHLNRSKRAAELYQAVLETAPDDREALDYLDSHFREQENWEMLEPIWATKVDLAKSPQERHSALERLAVLQDEALNDINSAYRSYETLLTEDPTRVAHLDRYVALAIELDDQKTARATINYVIPHLDPSESGEWRRRGLGPDTEDSIGSIEFFRERVRSEPGDVTGWKGLIKACERLGAWNEQIEALRGLLKLTAEEASSQVPLLLQIASIQRERTLDPSGAVTTYLEILELQPERLQAIEGLCAVAEGAGVSAELRATWLQQAIDLCADPSRRIRLLESYVALALPAGLNNLSVIDALSAILDLDPEHLGALTELEHRYRASGDIKRTIEVLEQRLAASPPNRQAEVLERLIRTQLTEALDSDGASATLIEWLTEYPATNIALELIETTLTSAARYEDLVTILSQRAASNRSPEQRTEYMYREAIVRAENLGEHEAAHALMQKILDERPDHLGALDFLSRHFIHAQLWSEANQTLERLVRICDQAGAPVPTDLLADSLDALAVSREQLGHDDRAVHAWERVLELKQGSSRALTNLGRLAWKEQDSEAAERYYRQAIELHGETLKPPQLAHIQGALGEIALRRGDELASRRLLEQALTGADEPTDLLIELIELCEKQEDWTGSLQHRTALLAHVEDSSKRFSLLVDTASIANRGGNLEAMFSLLAEAQKLQPESTIAAAPLVEVAVKLNRIEEAVSILNVLCEYETDSEKRAGYLFQLGVLYHDRLSQPQKALNCLNEALDLAPQRLEAFEEVDRILAAEDNWNQRADAYLAMLRRITDSNQNNLKQRLFRNLAIIYEQGLSQPAAALQYYVEALAIDPRDVELRRHVAQLRESIDSASEEALQDYRSLLDSNIDDLNAWQSIGRIFARQNRKDAVWCACAVLRRRSQLEATELQFYEAHQEASLALKRSISGTDDWSKYLYLDSHDVLLGRLFEWLTRASGHQFASRTLADLGLTPRDRVSLREQSRFTKFLGTVSKILDVPVPGVYRSSSMRGIRKEALYPPAMVIGPDVLTGRKGKELRFQLGKAMAYFTAPHLLAGMYPAGHLRTMVAAAIRIVRPEVAQKASSGVRGIQMQLEESLRPDDLATLQILADEIIGRGTNPSVTNWLRHVEHAANRAGHMLANDLDVSLRMLKVERQNGIRWSDLPLDDAVNNLQRYQVAEQYFSLRQEIGAAIPETT